ncbi:sugar ABC transporter permease [Paenibacillus sp. MAHUQ-46]|uniref:Sugar ABC transporter permease n=1 Tax=Paenibacillus roseus TaxID=2798579 RepID=A0A934J978_9BACL|nr:sugar ABC transporter permease [Paenibacillus roseus]
MAKRHIVLYLMPAVIFTLLFFVFPLIFAGYISLQQWNGINEMVYAGLDNFKLVFQDPVFIKAVINTLLWVAGAVLLHIPFGLLLALLLARQPRGWKVFRVLFVLPNVISTTAIAFLWYFVLHVNLGLVNNILKLMGLGALARPWLADLKTALFAHQLPFIIYAGLTMVVFLTRISAIPAELNEAAKIEGATNWQKDWYITIPLVKDAVLINIILNLAFCLRMFEYPLLMTGGGPANETVNLGLYMFKEMIIANRYGVSMAAGLMTIAVGAVVTGTTLALSCIMDRRNGI